MKQEWILKGLVGLLLLLNAWQDWKTREIIPWSLWAFLMVGIVLNIFWDNYSWKSILGGVAVGAVVLVGSWVSRSAIGMGDGFLLCVTGFYLRAEENWSMFFCALLLCAIYSLGMLLGKKAGRKTQIPFVPFLLLAFLCGEFL